MKIFVVTLFVLMCSFAHAKTITDIKNWNSPVKKVFNGPHVKLVKVEIADSGYVTYFAELPDPNLGHNSKVTFALYQGIADIEGCKDFSIYSVFDEQEIRLKTKTENKHCSITEELDPLKN